MDKLGEKHIEFLREAAADSGHTHEAVGIDKADLDLMVKEGLLIQYNRGGRYEYAITQIGIQVAASFGDPPELTDMAVKFVMTKGLSEAEARKVVATHGAKKVFEAKEAEERGDVTGQREIKAPDGFGLNIKKSF